MSKLVSVIFASIFAFMLFALMNLMIQQKVDAQPQTLTKVDFVEVPKLDDIKIKPIPPKTKKLPELTHQEQPQSIVSVPPKKTQKLPPKAPIKPSLEGSLRDFTSHHYSDDSWVGIDASNGHAELAPRVRIAPMYPVDAAKDNVQGYAKVQFDISEAGHPFNIRVIESRPKGFFEKSSRRAVSKWRYNPQINAGKATVVKDQVVVLDYKLESEA
ncbi:TonB family protein [Aliikangiella sp. IMCC44653]